MILNCIGVTRITRQMLEKPDEITSLEIESIEPNIMTEVRGSAFYFAYGNSAPLTLGSMVAQALDEGEQIFTVEVSINVKTANKDDTLIASLTDLERADLLVLQDIRQPVADAIIAHWHRWVETGAADNVLTAKDKANKFTETNVMRDMIARYPVFIDYLLQQIEFKHIKHVLFKAYTEEGNMVYLVANSPDMERYPDIPKNGINCSAIGDELSVVLPPRGRLIGGATIRH